MAFNGTGSNVTSLNASNVASGTLAVARGGTGTASPSLVAGSGIAITGTWPNQTVATSGGGGQLKMETYTSSGTWVCPAGVTRIWVQVCSGGTGSIYFYNYGVGGAGYSGNFAGGYATVTPGTGYSYTVSAGGNGASVGTSDYTVTGSSVSFSTFISITAPTFRLFDGGANGTYGGNSITQSIGFGRGILNSALFFSRTASYRDSGSSTGISWSETLSLFPGTSGITSGTSVYGGVGGAIFIMYVG